MEENPLKRFWIFSFVIGFCVGVWCASFGFASIPFGVFAVFLGVLTLLYSWRSIPDKYFREIFFLASIFLLCYGFGVLRFISVDKPINQILVELSGEKISVVGKVVKEPRERASYREYLVETNSGERMLVRADMFPEFFYGDKLIVRGTLNRPEPFETEGGRVFDYEKYLRKEGVHFILSFATTDKAGQSAFSLRRALFTGKNVFIGAIERAIPDPESSLLAGILLGSEESLGDDLLDAFRIVGIIHIIVLSGYNITLVAEAVMKTLSFLSRKRALVFSALGIVLFAIMVGAGPSVVRASLMALLVLVARFTHRTYAVSRSLLIALFVMVLWNPFVLAFDLGFQLSFLATVAIIWIAPIFEKRFSLIPEKFGLRDIASATLSTQLFVLPLLLYAIGTVSISGFIVNLIVLPIVPLVMFLGFVTGILSLISGALAIIPGFISYLFLAYIVFVSTFFANLPLSALSFGAVPVGLLVFLYLSCLLFFLYQKINTKSVS